LTANHIDLLLGDAPKNDWDLAPRSVLVGFHDVQYTARDNRRIEGVAALLEDSHTRCGGEPMRGSDDAERTDYLWPRLHADEKPLLYQVIRPGNIIRPVS
jgi:hypothetical protein